MSYRHSNEGERSATAVVQRGYNIRHLGYKASPATVRRDRIVQVEKLPEAKQAGGGIIQQPGFWGALCVTC